MSVLLVTYSLKNQEHDYSSLFVSIKSNANGWWHYIDNVWLVNTPTSANDFADLLYPHLYKNDRLLVTRITAEHQGWLPKEAWDWINSRTY